MKTRSFAEELRFARQHNCAVGAFNIFNYLSARAVIQGASEIGCPVILQTSAGTVRKFGPQELGTMLRQLAWNAPVNVLIHLDHCTDIELAKACIDNGWDSVMYDGSHLPLEQNIADCRTVAEYAHRRGVHVEGELGRIAGVEEDIAVDAGDATGASLEEALYFARSSGIDALAPAIGTAHGVYKGVPKINFDLVKQINEAIDTPIVIHGGTGLSSETFAKLIENGGSKVNVSTAIKHAYIDSAKEYFAEYPEKLDPIGFDQFLNGKIQDTAMKHMEMFRQTIK